MSRTNCVRLQLEALEDRLTPSDVVLPSAFHGLDVAVTRFIPSDPIYPGDPTRIVSPVFALNFGTASLETVHALNGLFQAVGQYPGDPISPIFFGLTGAPGGTFDGGSTG